MCSNTKKKTEIGQYWKKMQPIETKKCQILSKYGLKYGQNHHKISIFYQKKTYQNTQTKRSELYNDISYKKIWIIQP